MKKRIVALAGIAMLLCTGAVAKSREERQRKKEAQKANREFWKDFNANLNDYSDITGTPEDSVIFYGGFGRSQNSCIFTQINSDFEPDTQFMDCKTNSAMWSGIFFISKPVTPGSRYMLEYWYCKGIQYYGSRTYSPRDSILIIDIPEEPGLYYVGTYAGIESMAHGELTEYKDFPSAEERPHALKQVLSLYKGTAWEPLIQKELKEAEASAAQHKADRRKKKGSKK